MKRTRKAGRGSLAADDLPALVELARGYWHEDAIANHGSAAGAMRAYLDDAGDRGQLQRDLATVAARARAWSTSRLAAFFTDTLRSNWAPASRAELTALLSLLEPSRLDR